MSSMLGLHGLGWPKLDNGMLILVGAVIALIGPSSQDVATRMLRPAPWLALGAGAAMVYFLLLAGGPLQREFIYFQF
jgi:hypothetical protein